MKHIPILVFALLTQACTYGVVTYSGDGRPVANTRVAISTCSQTFVTTTDSSGQYGFDPYSASSAAFDISKYITPGRILIEVGEPSARNAARVFEDHKFDETCPHRVNNAETTISCKRYDMSVVPAAGWSPLITGATQAAFTQIVNDFRAKCAAGQ